MLIRPKDGVLVLEQLHYNDELRPSTEVPLGEGDVKPTELALAKQLIEQTSTNEFHPEKYSDQVRGRVLAAIQQKVEGQEITAEPEQETGGKIIDLMEALKASLAKGGKGDGDAAEDGGNGRPARRAPAAEDEKAEKPAKKRARA